ncbi:MAG TPA: hypothetical protein VMW79_07790 [Anaerolineae bacterium]|nr:hypothetical protein [Anaerolineae bacterium]
MKAKLEFELPEEAGAFEDAANVWKYKSVVRSALESIRGELKYNDNSDGGEAVLTWMRDMIIRELDEWGLDV